MVRGLNKNKLNIICIPSELSISQALGYLEEGGLQAVLIVDAHRKLLGIVCDGDVRRALLAGVSLSEPVKNIMNTDPLVVRQEDSLESVKEFMLSKHVRQLPVLNKKNVVVDVVDWFNLFENKLDKKSTPVLIMAGGKGTRLDPFTKILPKPMIPLGDKPIIEVIMDKFNEYGFYQFILCLGYKADIIRLYFNEQTNRLYDIRFVQEDQPLGTAGALHLAKQMLNETFIVTNCDIIVESDFWELVNYHKKNRNIITIAAALKEFTVPYGVLKTDGQVLKQIEEKPSMHYMVNTGLYVLEPAILDFIKENEFLHMTDLIERARCNSMQVGVYPHAGKWFDVGQWEEYRETIKIMAGSY